MDAAGQPRPGDGGRPRTALADPVTRWRRLLALTVVVTLVAATYAFTVGRDPQGRPTARPYADAPYYYAYAPSLLLDGDLDLRDEYVVTGNWYRLAPTATGRPGNVFGVGPALLTAPAFLVGHAVAVLRGERRDGFSTSEQWLVMWMSVLASVAALVFPARIAARRLDARGAGVVAALCVLLAGPVIYYAVRQPGYAHPFATFFAAWLVDVWDASYQRRRDVRTWALLGLVLGLAVLARPQLAPWALLPVLAAVDDLRRARRLDGAMVGRWLLGAAVSLVVVLPQLLAWEAIYGQLYVVPQGEGFMRWGEPAWSEVLFSSRNGLLPWAPVYALGLAGALAGAVRWPRLFVPLLVATAAQVWANGAAWDWWGGGAFGGRRFDSIYVVVALGLAVVLAPAVAALARVRLRGRPAAVARALVAAAVGAVVLALVLALTVGNLVAASKYSSPSARIHGGQAAADVLRQQIDGRLGRLVARASAWTSAPVRWLFAREYQVGAGAYDEIVGVHFLGETFPGLNSTRPPTHARLRMNQVAVQLRRGFVGGAPEGAPEGSLVIAGGHARIFVGLNRRGSLRLAVTLWNPTRGGDAVLRWNDRERVRVPVAASADAAGAEVVMEVADLRRGVNLLELDVPPGTVASAFELRATESSPVPGR